jgi:hypothetical protein
MIALFTKLPGPLTFFPVAPVKVFFQDEVAFAVDLADNIHDKLSRKSTFSVLNYTPASGVAFEVVVKIEFWGVATVLAQVNCRTTAEHYE